MKHITRIKMAAMAAALFVGGLTAAGFGLRASHSPSTRTVTMRPRTQVIHQTRVRTVHVRPKRPRSVAAPPKPAPAPPTQVVAAPSAQRAPVVVQAPTRVKSRVSPTGGRGEHEREHEREGEDD